MDESGQILYKVLSSLGGADGDLQKADDSTVPLSQLCRICALPNEYLIPIFEGEGQENNLADRIHSHLPIRVNNLDDYPDHVCYQCASTLLAFHDLVDCCTQADITLSARVQLGQSKKTFTKELNQSKQDVTQSNKERLLLGRHVRPDSTEQSTKRKKRSLTLRKPKKMTSKPPKLVPPKKVDPPTPHKCSFCYLSFKFSDLLTKHLLDCHSDLLFECDVCRTYLDRKELIPHMSKHAEQFAEASKLKNEQTRYPNHNSDKSHLEESTLLGNTEIASTSRLEENTGAVSDTEIASTSRLEENEDAFSISSHSKDRFDPIPDSVFEAIKDVDDMSDACVNIPTALEFSNPLGVHSLESSTQDTVKFSTMDVNSEKSLKTAPSRIVCPICSKNFRLSSSYYYHKKHFHEGVKEHTCNVCGRNFAVKSALKAHLTLHTGDKPYSCPQCSKQFRSKASVYIHYKNIHCETKTFQCNTCNRSFRWKQKLLRHIASHTKEKKFFCSKCNKGFAVKYDLTRHAKVHNETKPHVCNQCGVAFSQSRYLKTHTKKKHSIV